MKRRKGYRRGYPVAILVGLEDDRAVLWEVFSNVVKPQRTVYLEGSRNDPRAVYNFHESIVNALRPLLKEGVRSAILASPARRNHGQKFIDHIQAHHAWLVQGSNKAVFLETTGSAGTASQVATLTRTTMFRQLINKTTSEETENLIDMLEKRLNTPDQDTVILFSLKEIEDLILGQWMPDRPKPEYLILTDKYLSNSHEKNRVHRLLQIATNRKVRTKIVDAESKAGLRLTQLGGMVCFAHI